jgi:ribosomal protein S18 acetylase RimI-like enzyme
MLRIKHIIEEGKELDVIRDLFRAYEKELDEDICFQSFDEELKDPLKKYGPPSGDLILAYWEDEIAGCIALAKMKDAGACEMKRLYVKPSFRKNKIGRLLVEDLLSSAKEKNYKKMRLDTFLKLQAAVHLYQQFGFENISAYYNNPLPGCSVYGKKFVRQAYRIIYEEKRSLESRILLFGLHYHGHLELPYKPDA